MTFEQVANPLLGPSAQRPNLLTNGGMELWQRGNGPFTGSVWACDRWQLSLGGTSTMSVSKDTTNQDTGSQACAAVTYTQGTGSSFFINSAYVSKHRRPVPSRPAYMARSWGITSMARRTQGTAPIRH
jgi:hypothetical protein